MRRPARTPRMRRYSDHSKKKNKRSFLGKTTAFLVFGALVLTSLFFVSRESIWKAGERFTVVFGGKNPIVGSFSASGDVVLFNIPPKTQLNLPNSLGFWPAASAWELGEQEGKGGALLAGGVMKTFGFVIDGWIDEGGLSAVGYTSPRDVGETFEPRLLLVQKIRVVLGAQKTNLNFWERLRLVFRGTKQDGPVFLDLVKSGIVKELRIADSSRVYLVDQDRADKEFGDTLVDEQVRKQGTTVTIVNAAGVAGLGSKLARILKTLGSQVTLVKSDQKSQFNCLISEKSDQALTHRLARVFGCEISQRQPVGPAQIELYFGEEFGRRF